LFAFHPEILHFQAANRSAHPTILVAVIVDAAELADFPANAHALKNIILEYQIARVAAFGEKEIFFQRFRAHRVMQDVVLNISQRKVAIRNRGKILHPIGDGKLLYHELFGHGHASERKV
jgi:hypothetical protein